MALRINSNETLNDDELEGYIIKDQIGEGSFSKVYLSNKHGLKENYAIKVIQKVKVFGEALDRLLKESKLLKNLGHPNIIKLVEVCIF